MKIKRKFLYSVLALSLTGAVPVSAAVCYVDSKAKDCPATTAHKTEHKKGEKQAPASVGTTVHSEGTAALGSVDTHEHSVKLKENKPGSTVSVMTAPTTAKKKSNYKTSPATSSASTSTSIKKSTYKTTPQTAVVTDSHLKLQKYHETQQHEVQTVQNLGAIAAQQQQQQQQQQQVASGSTTLADFRYFASPRTGIWNELSREKVEYYVSAGWIYPDGTINPNTIVARGLRREPITPTPASGSVQAQGTQTQQLAQPQLPAQQQLQQLAQPTPPGVLNPADHSAPQLNYFMTDATGSLIPIAADVMRGSPRFTNPDGTLTPHALANGFTSQLQQPLGAGKRAKNPVPDFTAQSTPTPDAIQAPQMVQSTNAVPQQVVQTTPTPKPIDHPVLQTSANPPSTTTRDFKYVDQSGHGVALRQGAVQSLVDAGQIRPDGSVTPSGQAAGIVAQPFRTNPTPNLAGTPQQTPAPMQVQSPQLVPGTTPTVKEPDRIYYITHTDGVTRAWPARAISPLMFKPDGSLTQYALQHGYSTTPPVAVPTPTVAKAPQIVAQTPTTTPADFRYFFYNPATHAKTELTPDQVDRAIDQKVILRANGLVITQIHDVATQRRIIAEPKNVTPQQVPGQVPTPTPTATPQQVPQVVQVPPQPQQPLGAGKSSKTPVPTPNTINVPPMAHTPDLKPPSQVSAGITQHKTTFGSTTSIYSLLPVEPKKHYEHNIEPAITEGQLQVARPDYNQHVELYNKVEAQVVRYEEARQMKDDSFHLIVAGFKEP